MHNDLALSRASTKQVSSRAGAPSDEALVSRIAAGDENAMRILFARHQVRIYRFVQRLLGGDAATAEDIVSEVFLQVWRKAAGFEGRSRVSTWLLAIARYKALSALKGAHGDQPDVAKTGESIDPGEGPEAAAHWKDVGTILRRCLGQLSRAHREVIDLAYYHERSVAEVAAIMNVPPNTVKTRMFYARKQLAELLAAAGVDSVGFEAAAR
jgi:RNA polymerase sigma-70 factor (ECF subfamily)